MLCGDSPKGPWQHLAVNLFVFKEDVFVVLADYHSDFFEVHELRTTNSRGIDQKDDRILRLTWNTGIGAQ